MTFAFYFALVLAFGVFASFVFHVALKLRFSSPLFYFFVLIMTCFVFLASFSIKALHENASACLKRQYGKI